MKPPGPASIEGYLAELSADRRAVIEAMRKVVRAHLRPGFEENFNWGMISYEVPLATSGKTYNGQPLMYAALGNQKNHMALYLTGLYADEALMARFKERWRAAGKKLDMGKACLRFKALDDLDLEAVGEAIAAVTPEAFAELARNAPRKKR